MAEKTYINGIFVKEKETKFGKILSCSVKAESFIEEIRKHTNAKGYVNFDLLQRKESDKNGNTHYAVLNTYQKPETGVTESTGVPIGERGKKQEDAPATTEDDSFDLPF